jgi:hypothetical protein
MAAALLCRKSLPSSSWPHPRLEVHVRPPGMGSSRTRKSPHREKATGSARRPGVLARGEHDRAAEDAPGEQRQGGVDIAGFRHGTVCQVSPWSAPSAFCAASAGQRGVVGAFRLPRTNTVAASVATRIRQAPESTRQMMVAAPAALSGALSRKSALIFSSIWRISSAVAPSAARRA